MIGNRLHVDAQTSTNANLSLLFNATTTNIAIIKINLAMPVYLAIKKKKSRKICIIVLGIRMRVQFHITRVILREEGNFWDKFQAKLLDIRAFASTK